MKAILDEIATKISSEVTGASAWTIHKTRPVWTDAHSAQTLYIYLDSDRPSEQFRTTGSQEMVYRFALEFVEPADLEAGQLAHGETVEEALLDKRALLMEWAFSHQALTNAWRFDYMGTNYDNPRRPLDLQGFVAFVDAYQREAYT